MDELHELTMIKRLFKKLQMLAIELQDLHHWRNIVKETIRRYMRYSSMFFSPKIMKKIEFYRRHITMNDRYNVHAIKIQNLVRKGTAVRRVWRIKYIRRQKSNAKYLHFRYAISQYVKNAMALGVEKIFDKAKEKIAERKREKRNKEKAYAPAIVNKIIKASTEKAYKSLIAFYEREDYRYRLRLAEQVAARLQSNWRGRRERARMFEEK